MARIRAANEMSNWQRLQVGHPTAQQNVKVKRHWRGGGPEPHPVSEEGTLLQVGTWLHLASPCDRAAAPSTIEPWQKLSLRSCRASLLGKGPTIVRGRTAPPKAGMGSRLESAPRGVHAASVTDGGRMTQSCAAAAGVAALVQVCGTSRQHWQQLSTSG